MKWIQWWDEFILQWMWWVEINLFYLAPVYTIVNVGIHLWNSIIYIIIYRSARFQSPKLEIWFTSHASMYFKSTLKPEIHRWSAFHILPSVKWPVVEWLMAMFTLIFMLHLVRWKQRIHLHGFAMECYYFTFQHAELSRM